MFSYEFQKQLVVTAGAAIIYMVAIYALLDFTHTVCLRVSTDWSKAVWQNLKEMVI